MGTFKQSPGQTIPGRARGGGAFAKAGPGLHTQAKPVESAGSTFVTFVRCPAALKSAADLPAQMYQHSGALARRPVMPVYRLINGVLGTRSHWHPFADALRV